MNPEQLRAALKLVLLYQSPGGWGVNQDKEWLDLQIQAGIETPVAQANTRVLCDTIRKVLGESTCV